MNCCRPKPDKADSTEGTLTPKEEGQDDPDKPERNFEADIRELFQLFDTDNSKTLSALELGKAMMFLGMMPTDEEVEIAMKVLDVNGTGKIKFQEFFTFIQREMSKVNDGYYTTKEDVIRLAFQTFDKEGVGLIDENELRTAMKTMGECLTDRELEDMMKLAHVDEDGKIDYEGVTVISTDEWQIKVSFKSRFYAQQERIAPLLHHKEFIQAWCRRT